MEVEKAIKYIRMILREKDLPDAAKSLGYVYGTEAIETVLDYIKILERATDNKYYYVVGGRTLYSRLSELKKEDLIKAYLRLRNEVNQYIKENSIPKKKIENKINRRITKLDAERDDNLDYASDYDYEIQLWEEMKQELLEDK